MTAQFILRLWLHPTSSKHSTMPRALKQQSIPCKNKELGCTCYFSSANGVSIHLASCKFRTLSFGPTIQTRCSHISAPAIPLQPEHEHFNDNISSNVPSPTRDPPSPIDGHAEDHEVPEHVEYHPAVNGMRSKLLPSVSTSYRI